MWWQQRGPDGEVPGVDRAAEDVSLDDHLEN
jgi:hypothetical protein